jgi:hypothetical protein
MQVVLRMAANELFVRREGYVALNDASTHTRGGHVTFDGMLRELHGGAAMTYGKISTLYRITCAGQERVFERARFHLINQVERAWACGYWIREGWRCNSKKQQKRPNHINIFREGSS